MVGNPPGHKTPHEAFEIVIQLLAPEARPVADLLLLDEKALHILLGTIDRAERTLERSLRDAMADGVVKTRIEKSDGLYEITDPLELEGWRPEAFGYAWFGPASAHFTNPKPDDAGRIFVELDSLNQWLRPQAQAEEPAPVALLPIQAVTLRTKQNKPWVIGRVLSKRFPEGRPLLKAEQLSALVTSELPEIGKISSRTLTRGIGKAWPSILSDRAK